MKGDKKYKLLILTLLHVINFFTAAVDGGLNTVEFDAYIIFFINM